MPRNTRVKGHALRREGAPYSDPHCEDVACEKFRARHRGDHRAQVMDGRGGHALCECGWKSAHLSSDYQRKAAHRGHKAAVKAAMA